MPPVKTRSGGRPKSKGQSSGPKSTTVDPRLMTAEQVLRVAIKAGFNLYGGSPEMNADPYGSAITATAVSYAESKFDPKVYNGICCDGLMQIHRDHRTNPNVGIKMYGTALPLEVWIQKMQDPLENMKAAFIISGGGQKWGVEGGGGNPWEAYGNSDYHVGLKLAQRAAKKISEPGSTTSDDSVVGEFIPGVSDQIVGDAFGSAMGLFGWFGTQAAKAAARLIIGTGLFVGRLLYTEIVKPQFQHAQRATVYYWQEIMPGYGGVITVAFWGFGYAILWKDAEEIGASGVAAEKTALGRGVRAIQTATANRKLYAPKDAKDQTPKKPKAKESQAVVKTTRTAKVERKRTVRVGFGDEPAKLEVVKDAEPEGTKENVA